jgi:hypothetical protein
MRPGIGALRGQREAVCARVDGCGLLCALWRLRRKQSRAEERSTQPVAGDHGLDDHDSHGLDDHDSHGLYDRDAGERSRGRNDSHD